MKIKTKIRRVHSGRPTGSRQNGIALIMALIVLLIVSVLAAGVMFSAQSEIWTTASYRSATQARYVAEAGTSNAINWLQSQWAPNYASFLTGASAAKLCLNKYPVQYMPPGGSCATPPTGTVSYVLSGSGMKNVSDTMSAYDTATASSFATALNNKTVNVTSSVSGNYSIALQLLSAYQVNSQWVSKWKIVSQGSISGPRPAMVQVVEVVDNVVTKTGSNNTAPSFNYGLYATGTGCGVVNMTGSGVPRTNSYNSNASKGLTNPPQLGGGGDVGSNGNILLNNGSKIFGNVFSPMYNTGDYGLTSTSKGGYANSATCDPNGTVYAVSEDNSGSQVGCTGTSTCPDASTGWYANTYTKGNSLFKQHTYALPTSYSTMPDPAMPNVAANKGACSFDPLCNGGSGGGQGCALSMPPASDGSSFGRVNFGSCAIVTLSAGVYNFDTLSITNGAQVILPATGSVVINVLNASGNATPIVLNGGTALNNAGVPLNMSIVYAGTNNVSINAGAALFGTIYAPKANFLIDGDAGFYGAVVGKTFTFNGSGKLIYDQALKNAPTNIPISGPPSYNVSPLHVNEFSWSAF